ncbi:general transcription factor IIH polypeptide 2, putative [Eimeria mitis]|uniref:General transcription factor IIH polypeptide 2, putative n=1 Tax=Eimeria mitis TaxID=44415 RepID=U6KD01_9EIME|nr:general transcription factor IIH polypeptide 2, putative [Eimeria mitis]CDJ34691.1 general transcription factor IIH polypeptide 2, putative [Eimeria mitis]
MKQRNAEDYPSIDLVLQGLEASNNELAAGGEEEDYGQYASWECLVEAEGQLRLVGAADEEDEEQQTTKRIPHIKRALLRSLVILIDATDGMRETDFKPDRLTCATQMLEEFLGSFLLQNPLARIALVFMAESTAEVLCPSAAAAAAEHQHQQQQQQQQQRMHGPSITSSGLLAQGTASYFSSNVDELVAALVARRRRRTPAAAHSPSLKNGLDRARALLGAAPPYCTREVLVVYGSIRTCDVGSIEESISELKSIKARCSVVSLAPEVRIVKTLAVQTEGTFEVALHADHLRSLLMQHTQPPAW